MYSNALYFSTVVTKFIFFLFFNLILTILKPLILDWRFTRIFITSQLEISYRIEGLAISELISS